MSTEIDLKSKYAYLHGLYVVAKLELENKRVHISSHQIRIYNNRIRRLAIRKNLIKSKLQSYGIEI